MEEGTEHLVDVDRVVVLCVKRGETGTSSTGETGESRGTTERARGEEAVVGVVSRGTEKKRRRRERVVAISHRVELVVLIVLLLLLVVVLVAAQRSVCLEEEGLGEVRDDLEVVGGDLGARVGGHTLVEGSTEKVSTFLLGDVTEGIKERSERVLETDDGALTLDLDHLLLLLLLLLSLDGRRLSKGISGGALGLFVEAEEGRGRDDRSRTSGGSSGSSLDQTELLLLHLFDAVEDVDELLVLLLGVGALLGDEGGRNDAEGR